MAVMLPIEDVAVAADIMFILLFIQVNWTLISLRKKKSRLKRSFRVPFVPVVPIIAIVLQLILGYFLFYLSPVAWLIALIWLVLGVLLYYLYARGREKERAEAQIVYEEKLPVKTGYRILVPLAHPDHVDDLIQMASAIARDRKGEILALGIVRVPEQLPVAEGRRFVTEFKGIMEKAMKSGKRHGVVVNTLIRIGHHVTRAITDTIKERDIDLMVMGWKGFSHTRGSVFGGILDDVVMNAECDVMMIKMVHLEKMKSILLPTSGGPNACFALELAPAIAETYGSAIMVSMIVPPDTKPEVQAVYQQRVDESVDYLRDKVKKVEGKLVKARSISSGILKLTESFDACIIGAAREGLMQQMLFGSIPEKIGRKGRHTVIMVKKHQGALQNLISRFFHRSTERVGKR
ncbi:MAG: universal stress protein [Candidatus Aminicenantes bacterium]|nr:universal stress protein [Candidatus Aminicenantes bacterium]